MRKTKIKSTIILLGRRPMCNKFLLHNNQKTKNISTKKLESKLYIFLNKSFSCASRLKMITLLNENILPVRLKTLELNSACVGFKPLNVSVL